MERKGKAAGVSGGVPLAGIRGSAPRTLPRVFCAASSISSATFHLRQYEIWKVLEHPLVLQRSVDDPQKLPRQGDDRLARPAPRLHLFVVPLQIRAEPLRDQRALHQGRTPQLAAAFGDSAGALRLVGIRYTRHDPEVGRKFALVGEIVDITDHRKQNASR